MTPEQIERLRNLEATGGECGCARKMHLACQEELSTDVHALLAEWEEQKQLLGKCADFNLAQQNRDLAKLAEERGLEIERLRDIISPGDAAAYEEGMAGKEAEIERLKAERDKVERHHKSWHREKWGHGPCCTCQRCGQFYDDCRCSLDAEVDRADAAEARLEELRQSHLKVEEANRNLKARLAKVVEILADPMREPVRRIADALAAAQQKEEK